MSSQVASAGTKREQWAWYLYDFGNSAYAAVVLLAVFSAYFQGTVVGGAEGSRLWGVSVGIAMLVVAITSPIIGAIADFSGAKKKFLLGFTLLSVIATSLLFFVQAGDVVMGMVFFILAEIGYRSAQVFYNSLLPEIATEKELNRVSGNGWAIGSVGGVVCLLIVLAMIMLIGGPFVTRLAFPLTAVFYAVSAIPLFAWLRERAEPQPLPAGENYFSIGFKRLVRSFRSVKRFREFIKFVVSFLVYNDGIMMALDFAAILGAVLYGMNQQQLIIMMILVNVSSAAGAYVFGLVAERIEAKRTLLISLALMMASIVWMLFNYSAFNYYLITVLAGFALTGVQSVSRSMVSTLSPPGRSAEFYGFFAVSGRTSSFIGPTVFGAVALWAARYFERQGLATLAAEQAGQRTAVLTILAFLVVGTAMLLTVNENRGRALARMPEPALVPLHGDD